MAAIVVCGGGACGLLTAMLLAGDGHTVTVLERDPAPPPAPDDAWDHWERRGVNQFRLPHFMLPRFRSLMCERLPHVVTELERAGAHDYQLFPDERFRGITARRPVFEAGIAAAAAHTAGVSIRRGAGVQRLIAGTSVRDGIPNVVGVETEDGERIDADLVIDATGRRSPLPRWVDELGAQRPVTEELEDSGFVYYGRHLRAPDGKQLLGGPTNNVFGSVSLLALPGDDGTMGVGIITTNKDAELRVLRDEDAWNRVLALLPGSEPIRASEPISPLVSMGKIEDRWRRIVVDDEPVVTGVLPVADSWAATNPTLGRGITLGAMHAIAVADTIAKVGVDDPYALTCAYDEVTERELTPWYRSTLSQDRYSLAGFEAARTGSDAPFASVDRIWDDIPKVWQSMDVLVRWAGAIGRLQEWPESVLRDPEVRAILDGIEKPPPAGPTRQQLVETAAAT